MLFTQPARRAERNHRRPNFWTSESCFLLSNWFFECKHLLLDKPMVTTEPAVYTKHRAIRPGFESVSQQHAAHAQQRFYSIQAESFSSTARSSKQKKESAGRVMFTVINVLFCVGTHHTSQQRTSSRGHNSAHPPEESERPQHIHTTNNEKE